MRKGPGGTVTTTELMEETPMKVTLFPVKAVAFLNVSQGRGDNVKPTIKSGGSRFKFLN